MEAAAQGEGQRSVRDDGLSPGQRAAREELEQLLQRHAEHLGPWDEDGDIDVEPPCFLDGWILVANWTDSSGDGYLVRIPSANLPIHARVGLLHEGLYGFG